MMTMGLIPGTKVTVLRSAPLGDPIAIGVRSYNLALRKACLLYTSTASL